MEKSNNSLNELNNSYAEFLQRTFEENKENNIIIRTKPGYTTPLMRLITCIKFMESCIPVKNGFISDQNYNKNPIVIYIHNPHNNPVIFWNNEFISFVEYMLMNGMKIVVNFKDNINYTYPSWIIKLSESYKDKFSYYPNSVFKEVYCKGEKAYNIGLCYDNIDLDSTVIIYHKSKGQIVTANDFILCIDKPIILPLYFSHETENKNKFANSRIF